MSKNYAIIIQFVLPLTPFYRSGARRSDVYKRDAFVTSWRFHNRAWQPERHDRLPETSGKLWIHRGALTNQRCSLATGCGITSQITGISILCSTVCSGTDHKKKHQSPASLVSVGGIHRSPMGSPNKGSITQSMFPFDDVVMNKNKTMNTEIEKPK